MAESHYELAVDHIISSSQMSESSAVSKNSSRVSTCRICLSTILDAASLSCGHKFCERCLEKYWDNKDRPDFLVCPLCRGFAFDVNFSKKEPPPSTVDFRKTFGLENISETFEGHPTINCVRYSLLLPVIYYALRWLQGPLKELFNFLRLKITSRF